MKKYSQKKIKNKLKSRFNTQKRVFTFDEHQILLLPFLEHDNDIDKGVSKVRFYTDTNEESFKKIEDIKELQIEKNKPIKITTTNEDMPLSLFHKKMDCEFEATSLEEEDISGLTIEHTPSIQIVLYTMYLTKDKDFEILSEFCNQITKSEKHEKLTNKIIKEAGFLEKVKRQLENSSNKEDIRNAYSRIFNKIIKTEIKPRENNNANLSLESLQYFKKTYK